MTEGATTESPFALRIAVICVMFGTFMQMLDSTIANVALPYMQGSLQASRDQITWVLTSYIVASAITTAPVGWLASRFGRKNYLLISIGGFTLTSMLCGFAQSLDQMIVFRLLQGVFGAALSPLSQSIIMDKYPLDRRGPMMAIWGIVVMMGPIMGPTLGGFLTDNYSWRWVFFVNVPFGVLAVLGIAIFLGAERRIAAPRFDWLGFAFLAMAVGGLQFMLDRGTSQDWFESLEIVAEATIAGLGCYLFIVHFLTSRSPFIPHGLFQDRDYVSSLTLTFVIGVLMLATTALLPPFLQTLGGYTVMDTGLMLAPRGLGTMLCMLIVGRIVTKVDLRLLMAIGCTTLLWTLWEMSAWTPDVDYSTLVATTFIQGAGMGLVFMPSNMMAFGTLPASLRTDGSAIINLVRNVGSAIGVSTTTAILSNSTQTLHAMYAHYASPFNRALSLNAPSMMLNPQLPFGVAALNFMIERRALTMAYQNVFLFMFYLSLPTLVIILLMKKPRTAQAVPAPDEAVAVEA
jgi:DHA2 family multidrug resistance protein